MERPERVVRLQAAAQLLDIPPEQMRGDDIKRLQDAQDAYLAAHGQHRRYLRTAQYRRFLPNPRTAGVWPKTPTGAPSSWTRILSPPT
ncbi:hypothetical protein ULG90_03175 [Halopseudomonas pachastrellae]|nr:hypothetical protein ULG90_03175 [Halopseudomonas pachastrellae]